MSRRQKLLRFYFTLDLRSLGLYRILLGILLIADWCVRWQNAEAFYSSDGFLPAQALLENLGDGVPFTLFFSATSEAAVRALLLIALAAYVGFLVGYRTRLCHFLSLLFFASILNRNPFITSGADDVQVLMLLWSLFLPMGRRFSIDAIRRSLQEGVRLGDRVARPATSAERTAPSLPALGIVFQVAWVYLSTAIIKCGETWVDGTAIYYALENDQISRSLGLWLAGQPLWLIKALTHATLALEYAVAPMIFLPFLQPYLRYGAAAMLIGLHGGIWLTMQIGNFPFVMMATYALLLEERAWGLISRMGGAFSRSITLYYDSGCGVCTRACELLAIADRGRRIRFVGSGSREPFPHDVPRDLLERTAVVVEEATGRQSVKAGAAAEAFRALSLPFHVLRVLAVPPLRAVADRAYDLFAARRHKVSAWLGLAQCGLARGAGRVTPDGAPESRGEGGSEADTETGVAAAGSPIGRALRMGVVNGLAAVLFLVVAIEGYNINVAPRFETPRIGVFSPVRRILSATHFQQNWRLFAPNPMRDDGWWVVDGVTEDGRSFDPLTGEATTWEKPSNLALLRHRTWRKYLMLLWLQSFDAYRPYFCGYLTRRNHREKPPGERLARMELIYVLERTPPPGTPKPFPTERVKLGNFDCSEPRPQPQRPRIGGNRGPAPLR